MIADTYHAFENYIAKIFKEAGFSITQNVPVSEIKNSGDIDIVAVKDEKEYCVEVKYRSVERHSVERICGIAKEKEMIPVLVTAYILEEKRREYYQNLHEELILIDIANLLFAVKDDEELYNELIAGLSFSIDNIEPRKGFLQMDQLQHDDYTKSLIREMEFCESGKLSFRKYEELCHKLLKNALSEDLALWREQQQSNNDLYRFDLLCRIKDGNQKTFWQIIEKYFNSKYIIFEFKNYNEPVTQKEIYTTEKYLYSKALRRVGIIISAHGFDKNAYWAAKGCLRENGKLIILLDTKDLIEMNRIKMDREDPSNFLLDKLDNLLLELEK